MHRQVDLWVKSGYSIDRALLQSSLPLHKTRGEASHEGGAWGGDVKSVTVASLVPIVPMPLVGREPVLGLEQWHLDAASAALDRLGVLEAVSRGWDNPITQVSLPRPDPPTLSPPPTPPQVSCWPPPASPFLVSARLHACGMCSLR
jgi:hypothetical protein